jgi:DNA-directed RNA polymerase specialized sigma24 family protein
VILDDVWAWSHVPAMLLARSVDKPALFAGLYERHGLAVRRYVVRRVGDGAGDDLASEVFVRAFRARGRYRAEHQFALPWLMGIANHVIADHRRPERRRLAGLERLARATPELVEHPDAGLAPELAAALPTMPRPFAIRGPDGRLRSSMAGTSSSSSVKPPTAPGAAPSAR